MISLDFLHVFIENYCPLVKIHNSEGTGEKHNRSDEDSAETAAALKNYFYMIKGGGGGGPRTNLGVISTILDVFVIS